MGIFSKGNLTENMEYEHPDVGEYGIDSAALIISESYEGMYGIMESLYAIDMAELDLNKDLKKMEESDTDVALIEDRYHQFDTVLENMVTDTLDKFIKWVRDRFAQFMKFIDSVVKFFAGYFASGKAFAEKYEKELLDLNLSGYTHPMYEYENVGKGKDPETAFDVVRTALSKIEVNATEFRDLSSENAKTKVDAIKNGKDSIETEIRNRLVGKGDKDSFSQNLFKYFRGAGIAPLPVNIKVIIDELKSGDMVTKAQNAKKGCDKYFKPMIDGLTKAKNSIASGSEDESGGKFHGKDNAAVRTSVVAVYQAYIGVVASTNTLLLQYIKAWENAARERQGEFTKICKGAFTYAKKSEKASTAKKEEPKKEEPAK